MAYLTVPKKSDVVCAEHCNHIDCHIWREFFDSTCIVCNEKPQEGQLFRYVTQAGDWAHIKCLEKQDEINKVLDKGAEYHNELEDN